MISRGMIGGVLQGLAENKIHGGADNFFGLAGHLKQVRGRERRRAVERHQQIDVARRAGRAPGRRSKNIEPTDAMPPTKRLERVSQLRQ